MRRGSGSASDEDWTEEDETETDGADADEADADERSSEVDGADDAKAAKEADGSVGDGMGAEDGCGEESLDHCNWFDSFMPTTLAQRLRTA